MRPSYIRLIYETVEEELGSGKKQKNRDRSGYDFRGSVKVHLFHVRPVSTGVSLLALTPNMFPSYGLARFYSPAGFTVHDQIQLHKQSYDNKQATEAHRSHYVTMLVVGNWNIGKETKRTEQKMHCGFWCMPRIDLFLSRRCTVFDCRLADPKNEFPHFVIVEAMFCFRQK
jgi:hypothetical protein